MKYLIPTLALALLSGPFIAPAQRAVSTLTSSHYDKKKKETSYSVLPYGRVMLPGKWKKDRYSNISRQQRFLSGDSLDMYISIAPAQNYPFYKPEMSEKAITREMYNWDSEFLVQRINGERTLIHNDTSLNFITWKIRGTLDGEPVNQMFLFGSENGVIFGLSMVTDRWDDAKQALFLEDAYRRKVAGRCCD